MAPRPSERLVLPKSSWFVENPVLEPDERPKYDLNPRLSKFNWADLTTTFSAAAELEYQKKAAKEINEASFSAHLIGLPFAEHEGFGTQYLALIKNLGQLSDLTTRPEIKQLLLGNNYINLPEVDMYELVQ
jgi:hypothetical protein